MEAKHWYKRANMVKLMTKRQGRIEAHCSRNYTSVSLLSFSIFHVRFKEMMKFKSEENLEIKRRMI
jgi:hypothetical protein